MTVRVDRVFKGRVTRRATQRSGLTHDQWRTGRLVMGLLGLAVMSLVAWRVLRAWRARRRSAG